MIQISAEAKALQETPRGAKLSNIFGISSLVFTVMACRTVEVSQKATKVLMYLRGACADIMPLHIYFFLSFSTVTCELKTNNHTNQRTSA